MQMWSLRLSWREEDGMWSGAREAAQVVEDLEYQNCSAARQVVGCVGMAEMRQSLSTSGQYCGLRLWQQLGEEMKITKTGWIYQRDLTSSQVPKRLSSHAHIWVVETDTACPSLLPAVRTCGPYCPIAGSEVEIHTRGGFSALGMARRVVCGQRIQAGPMLDSGDGLGGLRVRSVASC